MSPQRSQPSRNGKRKSAGTGPLWFVAGGLLAVLVIFGFPALRDAFQHVGHSTAQHAEALKGKLVETTTVPPATGATAAQFDFYQLLSHPTQILTSRETREVQPSATSNSVATPGAYILQVASFRADKDAEALKAQLALWGVSASVQPVNVQGETWHRVRVGPVSDLAALNTLRSKLAAHKLQPLVMRVGN
ncbi:MAG: SPOR domain-containing protein [Gammaproteobacteria bacterium]